jgi:outer membrane protein assembly factor BamB
MWPRNLFDARGNFRGARLIVACAFVLTLACVNASAQAHWSAKLDGDVRFYQTTELGVLLAGTERSLYALDAETGDVLWRLKNARLDETDIAPVPGTDVLLVSIERGDRVRLSALDLLTGGELWRSDKVRGAVAQMAFDQDSNLLAVVMLRDARARADEHLKRKPVIHVLDLASGRELWKREQESEVELMPSRRDEDGEVSFTLGNYRPPAFLDGRLYLFYEGLTSLDARNGRERRREKFRVNEDGLALTEADPLADERFVYVSGRGRVRAISRADGEAAWESKDLGLTPELILTRGVIYARTGGRFTRLKDGETEERGPFGVSAIDAETGKTLWRYKGADKGITNIALPDSATIVTADRDDLIILDAATGKRRAKVSHKIEDASFILLNEGGRAVVGGKNEVACFDVSNARELWRERHTPPGRGLLRTVAAVAARAAALYFRYGGTVTTVYGGATRALGAAGALRWSGLASQLSLPNLTSLASSAGTDYAASRVSTFGLLSRARESTSARGVNVPHSSSNSEVEGRLLERLDPARQLERLSRFLWRQRRLAALRGQWMYFYTELDSGGRGLAGVNVNTGETAREIRLGDPDERFISDEAAGLLYSSRGDRVFANSLNERE